MSYERRALSHQRFLSWYIAYEALPKFHSSIALPNGDIYLIGGTQQNHQKSNIIYKFDFQLNDLNIVAYLD